MSGYYKLGKVPHQNGRESQYNCPKPTEKEKNNDCVLFSSHPNYSRFYGRYGEKLTLLFTFYFFRLVMRIKVSELVSVLVYINGCV